MARPRKSQKETIKKSQTNITSQKSMKREKAAKIKEVRAKTEKEKVRVKEEIKKETTSRHVGSIVLTCGSGGQGQLGHGEDGRLEDIKPRRVESIPKDEGIVQIAVGAMHSALLTESGKIFMCGANDFGAVPIKGVAKGDEVWEFTQLDMPDDCSETGADGKPVLLSAGASVTAVLTEKGAVYAFGYLRCADGNMSTALLFKAMQDGPTLFIPRTLQIVDVKCGDNHIVAMTKSCKILTFGDGQQGQLGRCSNRAQRQTKLAQPMTASLPISAGVKAQSVHAVAFGTFTTRMKDNSVWACGLNSYGQLGVQLVPVEKTDETVENQIDGAAQNEEPTKIEHFTASTEINKMLPDGQRITQIVGDQHTVLLRSDGKVFSIGRNQDHRLGIGTYKPRIGEQPEKSWREMTLQEVKLPGNAKAVHITARASTSAVVTEDGSAYAWGCDTCGQLGLGAGDAEVVPTPRKIISKHLVGLKIIQIEQSEQHTLILARKYDENEEMET